MTDWASTTSARVGRMLRDPDGPQAVLLLGAGASVSSGVPGAAYLAEMAARWAYCREHGRSTEDLSVTRSDWLPWLREHPWYQPAQVPGDHYPAIIEHLLLPRSERRRFFTEVLRTALAPSEGYQSLARLVGKGWIRTVLTTNFDDLIPQSLAGTEDKLAQIDATLQRQDQAVHLGMPAFPDIAGRSVPGPETQQ